MAAAAAPAAPAIAKAVAPPPASAFLASLPDPDVDLFKLIAEWRVARADNERAYQAFKPFEAKEFNDKRSRPDLPKARTGDVELGLRPNDVGWYGRFEVNKMRGEKSYDGDHKKENGMITTRTWTFTPSPEARAGGRNHRSVRQSGQLRSQEAARLP
jgi:hypothetical protein